MKIQPNRRQIAQTNSAGRRFIAIYVEQLAICMMKRNYGPSTSRSVIDIELMPSVRNFVPLRSQVACSFLGCAPPLNVGSFSERVHNQVIAHRQFGTEIFDRMIANRQSGPIWNADTFHSDVEQLPFHISPLRDGAAKFMLKRNYFFAGIHDVATKIPNFVIGRQFCVLTPTPSMVSCTKNDLLSNFPATVLDFKRY